MTRRVALVVAYDGTEFHGWQQQQPGIRTVQEVLEQSARRALRHQVALLGSGRTDRGVHAAGHVCSFDTTSDLSPYRMRHAIGSRLPKDVTIVAVRDVHHTFHATRSALSKLYRYRIHNTLGRPVERSVQKYTYHYWHALDVDRMREGAAYFVGEQDFSSMAATGTVRETMVRRVLRCDVERHLDEIRIDVEGTGFLYKQVRNMVGTLINVGEGRWAPERIAEILESRNRANGGATAPARGLCLRWVRYPAHLLRPPEPGEQADVRTGTADSTAMVTNDEPA